MTAVLFAVVSAIDGMSTLVDIARQASAELGRHLSPEDAGYLIDSKLRHAGLIDDPTAQPQARAAADVPILGLKYRVRVLPGKFVSALTRLTLWLYVPPIIVAVLILTAVLDRWLFFDHGLAKAMQQLLLNPSLVGGVLALAVASTAFHELGHATACRYGRARPGPIGVGLYLVWPVFYSDVTDTYRLGRAGRLRTDLGGVYFNVVSSLLIAGAYFETGFEPLLLAVAMIQFDALHQFFPFFRLDGYYVASDLIGVPDLFMRMKPMLLSFIPGRPMRPEIKALKPWARYALATWVYLTFVVIGYLYYLLIQALPRVLATAGQSFMLHLTEVGFYWHHGRPGFVALAVFDELMLVLPLVIVGMTVVLLARRLLRLWSRLGKERPTKRLAIAAAAATLLVLPLPTIGSSASYRPIAPTERGTLPGAPAVTQRFVPAVQAPRAMTPARPSPSSARPAAPAASPSSGSSSSGGSTGGSAASPTPDASPTSGPSPSPSPSPTPTDSPTPSPTPSPT